MAVMAAACSRALPLTLKASWMVSRVWAGRHTTDRAITHSRRSTMPQPLCGERCSAWHSGRCVGVLQSGWHAEHWRRQCAHRLG